MGSVTPCSAASESAAVWHAWQEADERREQGEWERLRMSCLCMLQPYSKKRLRAEDVMRFPWETGESPDNSDVTLNNEEIKARYEKARRKYGLD